MEHPVCIYHRAAPGAPWVPSLLCRTEDEARRMLALMFTSGEYWVGPSDERPTRSTVAHRTVPVKPKKPTAATGDHTPGRIYKCSFE